MTRKEYDALKKELEEKMSKCILKEEVIPVTLPDMETEAPTSVEATVSISEPEEEENESESAPEATGSEEETARSDTEESEG